MGEQAIGLVTGGILAISGLIMMAMGSVPRRRDRSRRRVRVAGPMLVVCGLLVFVASLVLIPQEDLAPGQTPLPTIDSDLDELLPP